MTEETRVSVANWVFALAKFCGKQARNLARKMPTARLNNKCKLRPERVFFKPIMADCIEHASFAATHLLTAFQLLYSYEPCKKYIVFPLGRMGMPGDTQFEMKTLLLSLLDDKFTTSHVIEMVTTPGYPLMIYLRLGKEWKNCGNDKQSLTSIREEFLRIVADIFAAVEGAGLIHLDARLYNFMYALEGNSLLSVKLIDWDSCLRIGRYLPKLLLLSFAGDDRYPQQNNLIATPLFHQYFYQRIVDDLSA
jgi:hypothetical protein